MKSARRGRNTSAVEVGNVSRHGFWLLMAERERLVAFKQFPWFLDATIGQLTNVELPSPHHLYWPALDIDLAVESLDHPELYPLVSQAQAEKRSRLTASVAKESSPPYKSRTRPRVRRKR